MREIKFRAWDKDNQRLIEWDEMRMAVLNKYFLLELLQYTGLHDKDGREIYEGDIIDARGQYSENLPQPVIWWDTGWYVGYDDGKHNNVTALHALEKPWVIGNIYENPDLLK